MTTEMGKPLVCGPRRGRQVRQGDALVRRARRGTARRRAARQGRRGGLGRRPRLRALPPAGHRPRRDAVELPALAGRPLRRARADGGQRRRCSSTPRTSRRPRSTWRSSSAGRASPRAVFQTLLVGSGAVDDILRDPRDRGRHPHRQRARGPLGRLDRRATRSRRRCWSWAAATRTSCCPPPTSTRPPGRPSPPACRTPASPASPPSASSSTRTSTTPFSSGFVERMAALKVGDPLDEDTDVGPLSSEQGRADLEELVDDATQARRHRAVRRAGARCTSGHGWYYEPTVLTGVTDAMRIHREEAFGPVASPLPRRRHRRGPEPRQRHPVRAQLQRVDARRRRAGAPRPRPGSRRHLLQRHDRLAPRAPFRRRQALRIRAGARRARHPRVLQCHHGVVRPGGVTAPGVTMVLSGP